MIQLPKPYDEEHGLTKEEYDDILSVQQGVIEFIRSFHIKTFLGDPGPKFCQNNECVYNSYSHNGIRKEGEHIESVYNIYELLNLFRESFLALYGKLNFKNHVLVWRKAPEVNCINDYRSDHFDLENGTRKFLIRKYILTMRFVILEKKKFKEAIDIWLKDYSE